MAKSPIIVVGHRNPDNDAICSALGYAYLKNELAKRSGSGDTYIAARLGPLPPESKAILEDAQMEPPIIITNVNSRVKDVMTSEPYSISHDASVLEAGRMLRKHNVRSLVVTNDDGTFKGVISTRAIAERYISATDALEEDATNSMAVAISLLESLNQKVDELTATDVITLEAEGLLKDATEDLMASKLREGVVLDDDGFAIGVVTRSDIATHPKRRVILVDHNERRQAPIGIEEAEVVEMVDHHRIADVMTSRPIQFLNCPVGATATIIGGEFRKYGVEIPKPLAEVLLSAIMTDTVILKSPTATPVDSEQSKYLADILGTDPLEFGLKVFRMRGTEDELDVNRIVEADSKEFPYGDKVILISQHETVDRGALLERTDE
ncbi:MAG: putative manganese-dependent inorganic diphosphatase, partial [Eggerthellaceae bacterium]|nr:putative manganese-dependent inorganic diphosphatase [Eggerthellaceae bacterium]